jgi:hypothetical protein
METVSGLLVPVSKEEAPLRLATRMPHPNVASSISTVYSSNVEWEKRHFQGRCDWLAYNEPPYLAEQLYLP